MSKDEKQSDAIQPKPAEADRPKQSEQQPGGSPFWRGVGNVVSEIVYERGAHGSAELASALFTGQGYVAYGHAKPAPEIEPPAAQQKDGGQKQEGGQKEQQGGVHGEAQGQDSQVQPPAQEAQAQQATQEAAAPKPQADLAERQDVIAPPRQAADQQQQRQAPRQ